MVPGRWQPQHEWAVWREQIDRLVKDWWEEGSRGTEAREASWIPPVDIQETAEAIVVTAEIPGMRENEIEVTLEGRTLMIRGERIPEPVRPGEYYHHRDRLFGPFQRTFTLRTPVQETHVGAVYRHGVLEIYLPKAEMVRPRQVPVTVR